MNPILIPLMSFSKMKPTNLTFLILSSSILINIFMNYQSTNKWFPLILTLLFSGGIMILFSFFSSILPNIKTMKLKVPLILSILIMMNLLLTKKSPILLNQLNAQSTYSNESLNLLIITSILSLLALNLKSHTIKINSPLKSSK